MLVQRLINRLRYRLPSRIPRRGRGRYTKNPEELEARVLLTADLPGDDLSSAQLLSLVSGVGTEFQATIGDGDYSYADVDLYEIPLTAGDVLSIDVDAEYLDDGTWYSSLDSHLRIFDASGSELASNYDGLSSNDYEWGYYDSFLSFTAPSSGTFYVGVSASGNEYYDPNYPSYGYNYSSGTYVLQLLLTGTGGGGGAGNQAPIAVADSVATTINTAIDIDVRHNDSDPDGDIIASLSVGLANHGTTQIVAANNSFGCIARYQYPDIQWER